MSAKKGDEHGSHGVYGVHHGSEDDEHEHEHEHDQHRVHARYPVSVAYDKTHGDRKVTVGKGDKKVTFEKSKKYGRGEDECGGGSDKKVTLAAGDKSVTLGHEHGSHKVSVGISKKDPAVGGTLGGGVNRRRRHEADDDDDTRVCIDRSDLRARLQGIADQVDQFRRFLDAV
jgi:hypothetical protein